MATGADFSEKMMSLMSVLPDALVRIIPSFHPLDLAVGACCGAGLRLAVYLKGKNAKKYRHGSEYGSARWGNAKDIEPYMAPRFEDNIILTQTERLTISFSSDPIASIWGVIGYTVLLCFTLLKTGTLTRSILNAH